MARKINMFILGKWCHFLIMTNDYDGFSRFPRLPVSLRPQSSRLSLLPPSLITLAFCPPCRLSQSTPVGAGGPTQPPPPPPAPSTWALPRHLFPPPARNSAAPAPPLLLPHLPRSPPPPPHLSPACKPRVPARTPSLRPPRSPPPLLSPAHQGHQHAPLCSTPRGASLFNLTPRALPTQDAPTPTPLPVPSARNRVIIAQTAREHGGRVHASGCAKGEGERAGRHGT